MNIDFAVVVPLYNKRPHVSRALTSILAQSRPAREIIVVDDSSTDGSADVVRTFEDERIRLLHRDKPGAGGYAARNFAIRSSECEWIAFLDADDEWLPRHLEVMAQSIEASGGDVIGAFTGFQTKRPDGIYERDKRTRRGLPKSPQRLTFDQLLQLWVGQRSCPIWTGAVCYRRSALLASGLFTETRCRRGGDKDLWLRASAQGDIVAAPGRTAVYHADSVNMVTRTTPFPGTHCIWASVEQLLQGASPQRTALLKRLYNCEIWNYVYWNWRSGTLDEECGDHFFADVEPARAIAVKLLMSVTGPRTASLLRMAGAAKRSLSRSGSAATAS